MTKTLVDDSSSFDPRVYLSLLVAGIFVSMLVHSEISLLMIFILSLIWLIMAGQGRYVMGYILMYALFWGITKVSVIWLTRSPDALLALGFSHSSFMARRAAIPLLFAFLLTNQSTGKLMASLCVLHIPKPFGIGLATMLRFFPTLAQEYRYIRNSQKFRGLGVGFWNTLVKLPQILNHVLIPLIIRITKISEELSVSLTVRGVQFDNNVVSFKPIKFTKKDALFSLVTISAFACIILLEKLLWSANI